MSLLILILNFVMYLFSAVYSILNVLIDLVITGCEAEERPGHHVKLYQYCSGDVDGMVQRHLQVRI